VNSITQVVQGIVDEQQRTGYDEVFNKIEFYAAQDGCIFQKEIHKKILKGN
jgi:hypothetical protein